ncbi:flagella basal body P-ring formation protein FlgA [Geochorda subterranea]|uniref:Flagella basal body P-ring formation protein FlgA n=1 Tax=Geochorda subterranea TaxID=3109564 RepID=A0ABZ1BTQ4_9FIRM|nr:flagella basal body P-ring formation protein FlgA [Limnochorda sp. LNt]WRP16005.1 flagella basal body P-ring formation protein FlgA [Limnochorda sp. LNt]
MADPRERGAPPGRVARAVGANPWRLGVAGLALLVWLGAAGLTGAAEGEGGAPPSVAATGRITLELRAQAETAGPSIRLGDVAVYAGGDEGLWQRVQGVELGAAPLPGQSRTLPLAAIEQRLRQARVDPATVEWIGGVEATVVTARGLPVEAAPIEAAIRTYLAGATGRAGSAVTLRAVEVPAGVLVPPGRLTAMVVSGPPVLREGPAVFAVDLLVDGTPQRRVWVRAALEAAAVTRGMPVIRRAETAAPPWGEGPRATGSSGDEALAGAERGTAQVPRGSPVTVVVRRGAVTVTWQGVSLEPAGIGEPIEVRNPVSGAVVRAVLMATGLAVVEGTAGP